MVEVAEIAGDITLADLHIDRADIVFDQQDSGCLSYGVEAAGHRWFVKTATTEAAEQSLRNSIRFHEVVQHEAIVRPIRSFGEVELTLLYPWIPGRVLNHATNAGSDRQALRDFKLLPLESINSAIGTVLDVHVEVAKSNFIAVDFYDGCLLYDFGTSTMRVIDLDEYRSGPFILESERLPGSLSYMAPEELRRGSVIDERSNVFTLGRLIHNLLDSPEGWRGSVSQAHIVRQATDPSPDRRFGTVNELSGAWLTQSSLNAGERRT